MQTNHLQTALGDVEIVVPRKTRERLWDTCFRDGAHLAGNFSRWKDSDQLFRDPEIRDYFREELEAALGDDHTGTASVTITCSSVVGWSSTAPIKNYRREDCEPFEMNPRSNGVRVRRDKQYLPAPKTNELTIVYSIRRDDDRIVALIHSLYPGPDIGELEGDVSAREKVVFFAFEHPGA